MGRKRADAAPPFNNLLYYKIIILYEWLWETNIVVVQNIAILALCYTKDFLDFLNFFKVEVLKLLIRWM